MSSVCITATGLAARAVVPAYGRPMPIDTAIAMTNPKIVVRMTSLPLRLAVPTAWPLLLQERASLLVAILPVCILLVGEVIRLQPLDIPIICSQCVTYATWRHGVDICQPLIRLLKLRVLLQGQHVAIYCITVLQSFDMQVSVGCQQRHSSDA